MIPVWVSSGLCLAAILWATLSPSPAGDIEVPLFPGADKVVHALMFGALTLCVCFDLGIWRGGKRCLAAGVPWIAAVASTFVGVAIEYLQRGMNLGRSFEPTDMLADLAGAAAAATIVSIHLIYSKRCHRSSSH